MSKEITKMMVELNECIKKFEKWAASYNWLFPEASVDYKGGKLVYRDERVMVQLIPGGSCILVSDQLDPKFIYQQQDIVALLPILGNQLIQKHESAGNKQEESKAQFDGWFRDHSNVTTVERKPILDIAYATKVAEKLEDFKRKVSR